MIFSIDVVSVSCHDHGLRANSSKLRGFVHFRQGMVHGWVCTVAEWAVRHWLTAIEVLGG